MLGIRVLQTTTKRVHVGTCQYCLPETGSWTTVSSSACHVKSEKSTKWDSWGTYTNTQVLRLFPASMSCSISNTTQWNAVILNGRYRRERIRRPSNRISKRDSCVILTEALPPLLLSTPCLVQPRNTHRETHKERQRFILSPNILFQVEAEECMGVSSEGYGRI